MGLEERGLYISCDVCVKIVQSLGRFLLAVVRVGSMV